MSELLIHVSDYECGVISNNDTQLLNMMLI